MKTDLLGKALWDYHTGKYTEDLMTETNISEADALPLPYLFRTFDEMPALEQTALKLAQGKILDVGCGAGCHGLYLQEQGFEVTGIDTSFGAVQLCKDRGLSHSFHTTLLTFNQGTYCLLYTSPSPRDA